jgi:L-threonylcarbamoyladenylate synthase
MPTVIVDRDNPDAAAIARGAELLRAGGLVAFPTETVYGLGAHALDAAAVRRIYEAKGRPSYNPLIVHIAESAAARELVVEWPTVAEELSRAFWPGPITLVLRKRRQVPDEVTAALDSVALRMPAHPVALALLRAARIPVAAPSANRSTQLSPTTAYHVERSLGNSVDLILDGGPTSVGIESTVLDVRGSRPIILRPGMIGPRELEPIVGPVSFASDAGGARDAGLASPGMLDRHYAPLARLELFDASAAVLAASRVAELERAGERVGALVRRAAFTPGPHVIRMPDDPRSYAQRLYDALHSLDDAGCSAVLVERVPPDEAWAAIRDRLERAAHDAGTHGRGTT